MAKRHKTARVCAPETQYIPTVIEFLLDETGSMELCHEATVAGYNDFLSEQKNQDGICRLTLTKFDSVDFRTPYVDLDIRMVPEMQSSWFVPGSSTNLYDAITARVADLEQRLASWIERPNVLFVIMTDGDDNSSHRSNVVTVKELIAQYSAKGWTFVYLASDDKAIRAAHRMGIPAGNIKSFEAAKMRETMQELAKSTTAFRAAATQTASFFA